MGNGRKIFTWVERNKRIEIIESKLGFRMRRLAVLDSSLPTHPTS